MPRDEFDELRSKTADKRSEKAILNDTLVDVSALPETIVWRNNTGQAWQGKRQRYYPGTMIPVPAGVVVLTEARPVNFGLLGSGDILGASRGHPLAIEVKDQDGHQSRYQRNFQCAWEAAGGVYLLTRSADEAVDKVRSL